jgi:predicted dehydrogenase/threonine dehydrogenase-like Zn-dependent dehydrogenase
MLQLIQDLKNGETLLLDVPTPAVQRGQVLIRTHRSLVSLGTERMLVAFGKANWLDKARQQPDRVKQVLEKVKSDGLKPTLDAVFRKLGEPLPLGYCNAGEVIGVGEGVTEFRIGDRVVSNGPHAEVVCIPQNLVAAIPDGVSFDEAVFTVIGAIALQGIRLIQPTFGETVVVTGLGLIGQLAAQLLRANGCRVVGLDFDAQKVEMARSLGIEAVQVGGETDPVVLVQSMTRQVGADAVLITASTSSNEVISQSARMSRKRGRIVLVGVVGLDIQRADFYEKELSFQVSCSYGPGRYDEAYEQKGQDYPIGFVRWTEKRNFEAILQAIASEQLQVKQLITEVVDLPDYQQVYGNMTGSKSIASILRYDALEAVDYRPVSVTPRHTAGGSAVLGILGAGNFTSSTILPALTKLGADMRYIASAKGLSGTLLAKKYKIGYSTTRYQDILQDPQVNAVLITTRHNLHAGQAIEALQAGKHVFVEKPMALSFDDLDALENAVLASGKTLTVGFNRRFSPFATDAKKQLGDGGAPINVVATMNAGFIPSSHWTQDIKTGGGRIIGEACHLIDLISYFTGSSVEKVVMNALGPNPGEQTDNASILLQYKNGSQGIINYFSNGSKAYSKERIEIYSQNRTIVIDNFRRSEYYGFKSSGMKKTQDKGHFEQFRLWLERLKQGGEPIVPFESALNTSRAALAAVESLKTGGWVGIRS